MGFERNYQVKILSNQINKFRFYTSLTALKPKIKLAFDSGFFTGFSDGESCFSISLCEKNQNKLGWGVQLCFQICLHKKDKDL